MGADSVWKPISLLPASSSTGIFAHFLLESTIGLMLTGKIITIIKHNITQMQSIFINLS